MPKFKIKELKKDDSVQFQAGRDWCTIRRNSNNILEVSITRSGSYEDYDIDEKGANRLLGTATSALL